MSANVAFQLTFSTVFCIFSVFLFFFYTVTPFVLTHLLAIFLIKQFMHIFYILHPSSSKRDCFLYQEMCYKYFNLFTVELRMRAFLYFLHLLKLRLFFVCTTWLRSVILFLDKIRLNVCLKVFAIIQIECPSFFLHVHSWLCFFKILFCAYEGFDILT